MKLDSTFLQALRTHGLNARADAADAIRFWASLDGDARTAVDAAAATAGYTIPGGDVDLMECVRMVGNDNRPFEDVLPVLLDSKTNASLADVRKGYHKVRCAGREPISVAPPAPGDPWGDFQPGSDLRRDGLADQVADAIAIRANGGRAQLFNPDGSKRSTSPRAEALSKQPMIRICEAYLQAAGVPEIGGFGYNRGILRQYAWDRSGALSMIATGDFPSILGASFNRTLAMAYNEYQSQWRKFARAATAPDFKTIRRLNLGEVPNLKHVPEGGEYTYCAVGERQETFKVLKYGRVFQISWEALVNDDLDAFGRIPAGMVRAAGRLEDSLAIGVLTANANMADNAALFSSTHGNLEAGTGSMAAPSVLTLDKMAYSFRMQRGLAPSGPGPGDSTAVLLNVEPMGLIVPPCLEGVTAKLLASASDPAQDNPSVANRWAGKLQLVVAPDLENDDLFAWYAFADPALWGGVEVCFLEGFPSPTLETLDQINPDVRRYSIRHVVGAAATDWRGLYCNPGH